MKTARKLIPALALLLVAAVLASTASYAWFTMSKSVTATNMGFTATAPDNLLISDKSDADFGTTTSLVVKNDLTGDTDPDQFDINLYPVSSVAGTNGTFYNVDKVLDNGKAEVGAAASLETGNYAEVEAGVVTVKKIADNSDVTVTSLADSTVAYIDYIFYVKTTGTKDVAVALDTANTTITVNEDNDAGEADKAVRLAIVSVNKVGGADALTTAISYAKDTAYFNYGTVTGPLNGAGDPNNTTTSIHGTFANETGTTTIFTAEGIVEGTGLESVYKVTARIWLEGESTSCVNTLAADSVAIQLGLKNANP